MSKSFKYFIILIFMYGSFQYGRVHDEGVKEYQPESNYIVITDRCEVLLDTNENIKCIWYKDQPYIIDPILFENP